MVTERQATEFSFDCICFTLVFGADRKNNYTQEMTILTKNLLILSKLFLVKTQVLTSQLLFQILDIQIRNKKQI